MAFSIHLVTSLIIFLIFLYYILSYWYPSPYFTLDGGWQGIRIMLFVDIFLGPFLTLLFFKAGKPSLKFDMCIIAGIQCIALAYGGWNVYDQRTAAVVYSFDGLYTRNPEQIRYAGLTPEKVAKLSTETPPLIYLRLPKDKTARSRFIVDTYNKKKLVLDLGDRYEPMTDENLQALLSSGMNMKELEKLGDNTIEQLKSFAASNGSRIEDFVYIPLHGRYKNSLLAFRHSDGKIIGRPNVQIPTQFN